jgi:hypothetical protein
VSESEKSRKHDLECLRLASDCMQLAGEVRNPAWQRHFLRMAKVWTARAEGAPGAEPRDIRFSKTESCLRSSSTRAADIP